MISFVFQIAILFFCITVHEFAHAAAAEKLGDPTARKAGRVSLNPLKHIDLMTTIILPLVLFLVRSPIIFGMAKPVPINPLNFRDKKYGPVKSALAGPGANLGLALGFGLAIRLVPFGADLFWQNLLAIFSFIVLINLFLALFNLMPIPPLDGSHLLFAFLPQSAQNFKLFMAKYGFFVLIFVLIFLLPVLSSIVAFFFRIITGFSFF